MNPDLDAIRRCVDGDRNSFGALVRKYERRAIAHALTILTNRDDALDAVQEAFTDAYKAIATFDQDRNFYPWLYVILRNRCYATLRKRQRRPEASEPAEEQAALVTCPDFGGSMDLNSALNKLAPEEREILLLKYVDGLKYKELAEKLGIAIGTVMSRLHHARGKLRQVITRNEQ